MISERKIKNISKYSMIDFKESDLKNMGIDRFLKAIDEINSLDLKDIEPLYRVSEYENPLREDVPTNSLDRDLILENSKETQYGFIKLKNIR